MTKQLETGVEAPDFTLADVQGRTVRLSDYRGRKHVVLVFNRGFTCPFCRRHLAQLRQDYQKFVEREAEVVVVGPDERKAFARRWQREGIPFVGLPDPEHRVADLYGQEVSLWKLGRMPTLLVVDKAGKVRYRHYGEAMWDTPANSEVLAVLDGLRREEGG